MVKLTKKGTPVKNKSFDYGISGEYYVRDCLQCPICSHRMIQLKANTPAMDFKCSNSTENHWFQLKTYDAKRLRLNNVWNLECGEYILQKRAFFNEAYRADLIVIRYTPKQRQVNSIHWFRNQDFRPAYLTPNTHQVKTYSRKNGIKKETGQVSRTKSMLRILSTNAFQLRIPRTHLPNYFSIEKNAKPEKAPIHKISIHDFIVCLNDESCECNLQQPSPCIHLQEAWKRFLETCPNHRKVAGSQSRNYAVDLNTMSCTCPRFAFRKKFDSCKHLQEESKTICHTNYHKSSHRDTDDFYIDL